MIARSFQRLKRFRIPLRTKENEIVNFSEKKMGRTGKILYRL